MKPSTHTVLPDRTAASAPCPRRPVMDRPHRHPIDFVDIGHTIVKTVVPGIPGYDRPASQRPVSAGW
ncbi:hypothetical protein [Streptomyces sp. NPDC052179]|uniref:hypothetical protein n=1 Tax=Streptomyces sp. NPDC052179 TaxID=3155680 RepID=UPI00343F6EA2